MPIIREWSKVGSSLFKADAQKVGEEIDAIGEEVTPRQIVDKATDSNTELHKCFEWDDVKAADKYRLQQARNIMCCLVVHRDEKCQFNQEVRAFHHTESGSYKTIQHIYQRPDEYARLLQSAYADLEAFKRKYKNLQELEWLIEQFP